MLNQTHTIDLCKQAYRYGLQFGQLVDNEMTNAARSVQLAYRLFLRQLPTFSDDVDLPVLVREQYARGLCDMPSLIKID